MSFFPVQTRQLPGWYFEHTAEQTFSGASVLLTMIVKAAPLFATILCR
jgi:hypothetical protein